MISMLRTWDDVRKVIIEEKLEELNELEKVKNDLTNNRASR